MKTLFERQFYEHIHHEYKSGEHFDSLSSRQPCSDLLWPLCGKPLLTASIVISLFSPRICLQEEGVCSPCNFTTETPFASPSDVQPHPARESRGLCYTDHPYAQRDRLYQLMFPWHHAEKLWQNADNLQTWGLSPAKVDASKVSIVSGRRSKDFFFFALCPSL